MQEARFNSRWRQDIESQVVCEKLRVPRMPSREGTPRLSGPSIRRTIAGAVSGSRSPLQVPSDEGAVMLIKIDNNKEKNEE